MPGTGYVSIGAVQPGINTGTSLGSPSIGAVQPYLTAAILAASISGSSVSGSASATVPNPSASSLTKGLLSVAISSAATTTIPSPAFSTSIATVGTATVVSVVASVPPVPAFASATVSLGTATVVSTVVAVPPVPAFASVSTFVSNAALSAVGQTVAFVDSPNTLYTGDDLIEAIWTFIDPVLDADFGRAGWLWRNEAPRSFKLPYATIFSLTESEADIHTGDGFTFQIPIAINVFGSQTDALRLGDLIQDAMLPRKAGHAVFAWKTWYELSRWSGSGNGLEKDPDRGPDGSDVYIYRLNFTFLVAKSYPIP